MSRMVGYQKCILQNQLLRMRVMLVVQLDSLQSEMEWNISERLVCFLISRLWPYFQESS